jgi:hypothetical protein
MTDFLVLYTVYNYAVSRTYFEKRGFGYGRIGRTGIRLDTGLGEFRPYH